MKSSTNECIYTFVFKHFIKFYVKLDGRAERDQAKYYVSPREVERVEKSPNYLR